MSLRLRLTLVAAAVVAVVVAVASITVYFVMRHELYKQVDSTLAQHAKLLQHAPDESFGFRYQADAVMFVNANGHYANEPGAFHFQPINKDMRDVATGKRDGFYRDVHLSGYHVREIVAPLQPPFQGAVVVAQVIDNVDHELGRLQLILILVSLGAVALAALGGALVARATLAPVRRLTAAAERITRTGDPSERVPERGRDELSRLGTAFNTMLGALEESLETQRRFVADASHELRTPLTSLQTNIEVLKRQERLAPEQRARLFADLEREAHEMRDLIGGLLELARGDANLERRTVQLDELVESAADRARSRFPLVSFEVRLEPTVIDGIPERLERAVWNLLENAGKWSDDGSVVEVTLADGEVRVRDHGPGIAPEDREHVFDRFYRAPSARALPGSGLGLAIVREVAEAHGGSVSVEDAPGGGALLRLRLPAARPSGATEPVAPEPRPSLATRP
jgi:two-component system sensor histidine kinase MprB